ncbi:MAG: hypothetical protein K1W08_00405 [Lachnospiraceae bacterium]
MNYEVFQTYLKIFRFDEVKVIGKDVMLGDVCIHVVGMGFRRESDNKGPYLYLLEEQPQQEECAGCSHNQTKRETMLESGRGNQNDRKALHISQIQIGETCYTFQGGGMGNLMQADFVQAYLLFQQMMEAGWRIPETSPFYEMDWNQIGLAELRLSGVYDRLPELSGEIRRVTLGMTCRQYAVQMPVQLERGKTAELRFALEEGGEEIVCYVNQVGMSQPLLEQQERFEDAKYREMALQYQTIEEFENMKKSVLNALEEQCPAGMGYFTVEYECTGEGLSAQFYTVAELDGVSEPAKTHVIGGSTGVTTIMMMGGKPEQEIGPHGLRSRTTVVQTVVPVETQTLAAELFLVIETIPEKEYENFL